MKTVRIVCEEGRGFGRTTGSFSRSASRGLSVLDPQLTDFIQDLETNGRESSLKNEVNMLQTCSSMLRLPSSGITPGDAPPDPFLDLFGGEQATCMLGQERTPAGQSLLEDCADVIDRASFSSLPCGVDSGHKTQTQPPQQLGPARAQKRKLDAVEALELRQLHIEPAQSHDVDEAKRRDVDDAVAREAARKRNVDDPSANGAEEPKPNPGRRRSKRGQSTVSRFCHVCTRSSKSVALLPCGNFFGWASCRKVVCEKCFARFNWNWNEALNKGKSWRCSHCTNRCPPASQCNNYKRVNNERRIRELMRQKQDKGAALQVGPCNVPTF